MSRDSVRKVEPDGTIRDGVLRRGYLADTEPPPRKPNFLVIGAAKAGTTAIWHHLRQHPQIYMSDRKHTRFFAYDCESPAFNGPAPTNPTMPYAIADVESYLKLFRGATDETAIGEVSHSYLYRAQAAARIREYAPQMKLIAVLRNPADRAYSHYSQMVRNGREQLSDFYEALDTEEARVRDNWWPEFHYIQVGLYHAQLKRYFELFDPRQIKVYLYEDLSRDPRRLLRDAFSFLDVDETFVPSATVRYNASGLPKNKTVHLALQELRRLRPAAERMLPDRYYQRLLRAGGGLHNRNLTTTRLSPEERKSINSVCFREDILKLQDMLSQDLSGWLA